MEEAASTPMAVYTEENELAASRSEESHLRSQSSFDHAKGPSSKLITHSFHTKASEVRSMEQTLMQLLDDFNSGRLRAFGQGCSMRGMEELREQQERLARLHLEVGGREEAFAAPLSDSGLNASKETMKQLMQRLETLSDAIESLNPGDNSRKNGDKVDAPVRNASSFRLGADEDEEADRSPKQRRARTQDAKHVDQAARAERSDDLEARPGAELSSLDSEETLVGHSLHNSS